MKLSKAQATTIAGAVVAIIGALFAIDPEVLQALATVLAEALSLGSEP